MYIYKKATLNHFFNYPAITFVSTLNNEMKMWNDENKYSEICIADIQRTDSIVYCTAIT